MIKRRKKLNLRKIKTIDSHTEDVVRVLDFKVSPVKSKKGKNVTVNMVIKNVSPKTLRSVPWQIGMDDEILNSGTRYNLGPGDSFKVCITWTAEPGHHFIYGDADPHNTLKEPRVKQYNNLPQGFDVVVK